MEEHDCIWPDCLVPVGQQIRACQHSCPFAGEKRQEQVERRRLADERPARTGLK